MSVTGNHIDISDIGKNPDDQVVTLNIQFICGDQFHGEYKISCHTGQYISDINEILTNIKLNNGIWINFYYHEMTERGMKYIPLNNNDKVSKIFEYNIRYNRFYIDSYIHNSLICGMSNIKLAKR